MRRYAGSKFRTSMLGVTLLEVMLVLAIAAMIIVMSLRYYQATSQNSQFNQFMSNVQGVVGAVESLTIGSGDYNSVSSAQIVTMMGNQNLFNAPWGGQENSIW